MAIDPTGYTDAIATIPEGQLSERQQRIAAGLAMIRDGTSIKRASEIAKVPLSTLWNYHHKGRSIAERETKADYNVAAVTEMSVDISLMAAERVRDRLADDPDSWSNMDLVKAYGVATDKLIAIGARNPSSGDDGISELSKLLRSSKVTIEPKADGHSAIDVEADVIG
jgi:hypothetical protein